MLKSKMTIDSPLLDYNGSKLDEALNEISVDSNTLINMIDDEEWVINNKLNDLKKIIYRLNDLVRVELIDKDIDYSLYDSIKKLFLIMLSEEWESDISMASAYNTLNKITDLEEKMGKCVIDFTSEEIEQSIVDLFSEMKYHKLRYQLNIISKLQIFYKDYSKTDTKWSDYRNVDKLKSIIGDEAKEHVLTKKDLINLTKIVPNVQDSIIPLLIFEGVAFSKIDNFDEIRYLKHSDLKGNNLTINGNGSSEIHQRVLDLSSEVASIVKDAINQDFIEKKVGNEIKIIELQDSEYILRPSINSRKKINEVLDENILSFRGAYSRLSVCKIYLENMLYDVSFSPKVIEKFGKIYYINKLINEGYDKMEAITLTLQRFGNWYPEEGGRSPKNSQQINRLKKLWEVYA